MFDYLRKPRDCKFAYTLGSDDQIIFDDVNSVDLEWDTNMVPDFLGRLESRYGVYVKEELTTQMGQLKRSQTKS